MKKKNKTKTDIFIEKSKKVHGDKYDYSKSCYVNSNCRLIIICPIHGEFEQTPYKNLLGRGCNKCGIIKSSIGKRSNNDKFISKSILIHGNKYNYDKVVYVKNSIEVIITCPLHGDFNQKPCHHLKSGCLKCGIIKSSKSNVIKIDDLLYRFNKVHDGKYKYNISNYMDTNSIIDIVCPHHGEFKQISKYHLSGRGCNECGVIKQSNDRRMGVLEFINRSNELHDFKYDYNKVVYVNNLTKVIITCRIHGDFEQIPNSHLIGYGCFDCGRLICSGKNKLGIDKFIEKSKILHNDRYDYSLITEYVGYDQLVNIICKKHGIFEQRIGNHLSGNGCSFCNRSKGENIIKYILDKYLIKYESEKRYDDCRNLNTLPFDFYLSEYNILIEFDGVQHYEAYNFFGGELALKSTKNNDSIKTKYCLDNNIKLIRIPYYDIKNIESILKKELNIND